MSKQVEGSCLLQKPILSCTNVSCMQCGRELTFYAPQGEKGCKRQLLVGIIWVLSLVQAAANTALRGERVVYIDAGGAFQARRFAAVHARLARRAAAEGGDHPGEDRVTGLVDALGCVELFALHDLPSLLQLLAALHARLQACL